ncbi:MAG: amidohydrolase family protein [Spirochaetota bacterium]
MISPFIVDAHVHTGFPGTFFAPEVDANSLLKRMDQFHIKYAINLGSMRNLRGNSIREMEKAKREYEESGGRIFYCGFYDPKREREDLALLRKIVKWKGFVGIKIHPSLSRVSADDDRYEHVWKFALDHGLPIVTHSWSVSIYNPVQVLSTPDKFERHVKKYPEVRFVLAHSGGRGEGRFDAMRMVKDYENIYIDFAGDIYCHRYFETMAEEKLLDRVIFGTDYPFMDHRSHLTRVYLAEIPARYKIVILQKTALNVFRLEGM